MHFCIFCVTFFSRFFYSEYGFQLSFWSDLNSILLFFQLIRLLAGLYRGEVDMFRVWLGPRFCLFLFSLRSVICPSPFIYLYFRLLDYEKNALVTCTVDNHFFYSASFHKSAFPGCCLFFFV